MKGLRLGIAVLLTALLVATGIFVSGVVQASHNFSDVPTTAFYHNAVEWVFNRGITAGCAAGLYCPNDAVTRGTMAVFLRALGVALTPQVITDEGFGGAVDIDTSPVLCSTVDYSPTFPQRILARGWISLVPAGLIGTRTRLMYSTNAGTTWNNMALENSFASGGTASANHWYQATDFAYQDLSPGTTYRFGVMVTRRGVAGGTADATAYECEFMGEIINRNPGTPPLSPKEPERQDR